MGLDLEEIDDPFAFFSHQATQDISSDSEFEEERAFLPMSKTGKLSHKEKMAQILSIGQKRQRNQNQ